MSPESADFFWKLSEGWLLSRSSMRMDCIELDLSLLSTMNSYKPSFYWISTTLRLALDSSIFTSSSCYYYCIGGGGGLMMKFYSGRFQKQS